MLKKRIIPCLDIKDGRTVKGTSFVNLRDAGDPVELAMRYAQEGADELVFLDITATVERRKTLIPLVQRIAQAIDIPFAVGGGIQEPRDVKALLQAGADKVCINSAALADPDLITSISNRFGRQCLIVAIDAKVNDETWQVYSHGGRMPTGIEAVQWARKAASLGAGELLVTSIDTDGQQSGFHIDLLQAIASSVSIPVIASGGAGSMADFSDVFGQSAVSAALAASVFHFGTIQIPQLKSYLLNQQIPVRCS